MALKFDGDLRWICLRCGQENPDLRFVVERDSFVIEGSKLIPLDPEVAELLEAQKEPVDLGEGGGVNEEWYFCCPNCGKWVDAELVRDGFREWLRRTRRENPEKYAKLMSKLLNQIV
jgi:hypothetical protein